MVPGAGREVAHPAGSSSAPRGETELEELLSRPPARLAAFLSRLEGDLLILGAGGKMGPTVARMARRGLDACCRVGQRVIAVSRFSQPAARLELDRLGIATVSADLMERTQVNALPEAENVLFMAGQKFGTADAPEQTWLTNCFVPVLVAERFAASRIVVFSTGCVYPHVPVDSGGAREEDPLEPLGEYANSCVGRERIFAGFSHRRGTPVLLFRLNYAIDLRYGVLVDVARKVQRGEEVDVSTGFANVIWQGDASACALESLGQAASPPLALNVTGRETVSIRELARRFGELFGREPRIMGREAETALLADASRARALFGEPAVPLEQMIRWTAEWLASGGRLLNKPTHYETRDGRY